MVFGYSRSTRSAIAAMSRLAEVYDGGRTFLAAADVAAARNLQKPFVSKLLTVLSQAGLVVSVPGPHGGFALARPPAEISIYDIVRLFDRELAGSLCPFGPGYCGSGKPCPLHQTLLAFQEQIRAHLQEATLALFDGGAAGAG